MGQGHHVIDVRVFGQQFVTNALDCMVQHAGHALHGGGDPQNVAGAHRTVGVAVALEGVTLQRCLFLGHRIGHRQAVERRRRRHAQLVFPDPTATRYWLQRVTDGVAITNNGLAHGQVNGADLVALRHVIDRHQAVVEFGSGRHTLVVDHDHDVIQRVQPDVARRVGMLNQVHHGFLRILLRKGR